MARHTAWEVEGIAEVLELAYDTDDVAEINIAAGRTQADAPDLPHVVTITFKPGRHPRWLAKQGGH